MICQHNDKAHMVGAACYAATMPMSVTKPFHGHTMTALQTPCCFVLCITLFKYHSCLMTADLVRSIHPVPHGLEMDFLRISSYVGTQSSGSGTMAMQSRLPVKGRHVLVVSLLSQEHINTLGNLGAVLLSLYYIPRVVCCCHCPRCPGYSAVAIVLHTQIIVLLVRTCQQA